MDENIKKEKVIDVELENKEALKDPRDVMIQNLFNIIQEKETNITILRLRVMDLESIKGGKENDKG